MTETEREALKRRAAEAAVQLVKSGQVLGLGSGSTAAYAVRAIGRRLRSGQLEEVLAVPTSSATQALAESLGIPLTTLEDHPRLDLTIDGADEVDPQLNLIKGGGGALLREKVVAAASRRFVVVVDETKLVSRLGEKAPLPVEVLPFGWTVVRRLLEARGAQVRLRLHAPDPDGEPFRTDQGHYILDCRFPPMDDPHGLARALEAIPGVLGHGLFLGMADEVRVGTPSGVERLRRPPPDHKP